MKKLLIIAMLLITASSLSLAQRTLLNKGDQYLGARLAIGSVAGASIGYVANFEMGLMKNIGVGATVGYAGQSQTDAYWDVTYSDIIIMVNGTYHYDLLKSEKIDTWGAVNLGYDIQSASATYTGPSLYGYNPSWTGSASSGLMIGGSANIRYKLSPKFSAVASVGFGMGLLNIGIDYKL